MLPLLLIAFASAARWQGQLHSSKQFEFVDRFAFADTGPGSPFVNMTGTLNFTFLPTDKDARAEAAHLMICLYFADEWQRVWNVPDSVTCDDKAKESKYCYNMTQNAHVAVGVADNHGALFWYIALLNCQDTNGAEWSIEYDITCLNPGGVFTRQFAVNEWGFYRFDISLFVFYTILLLVHVYACIQMHRARCYHVLVKMLTFVVGCEWLSSLIYLACEGSFANNGFATPAGVGIAQFIDLMAQVVFIMLLMLIAQGWSISSSAITNRKVLIMGFAALVTINLVLFIWQFVAVDPTAVVYIYETVPGILLLVLRAGLFVWFLLSLRVSYNAEDDMFKKQFYVKFGAVFGVWFISLIVIVCIGAGVPALYRELTATILNEIISFIALGVLVALLWPSAAQKYFAIAAPDLLFSGTPGKAGSVSSSPYEQL